MICPGFNPHLLAFGYVEEISLAAMLATKRSVGVTPEVNLREHVTCTPLPSMNTATQSGFEIQRRHHQKLEIGISVAPTKRTYVLYIYIYIFFFF